MKLALAGLESPAGGAERGRWRVAIGSRSRLTVLRAGDSPGLADDTLELPAHALHRLLPRNSIPHPVV
jgi:hypothetical protein